MAEMTTTSVAVPLAGKTRQGNPLPRRLLILAGWLTFALFLLLPLLLLCGRGGALCVSTRRGCTWLARCGEHGTREGRGARGSAARVRCCCCAAAWGGGAAVAAAM